MNEHLYENTLLFLKWILSCFYKNITQVLQTQQTTKLASFNEQFYTTILLITFQSKIYGLFKW